jgi:protein-S-isoprenylcysteine O-methyltransferase Ste14
MEIRNAKVESFLKSFAFSFLLCLYASVFVFLRTRALLGGFDFFELLHLIYNVAIALLFLIRIRPSVVSMNPVHWVVALITAFSGFFFVREGTGGSSAVLGIGQVLIVVAFVLGIVAALTLGRSYGFLPALRHVKAEYLYQIVRHPMYLSSIIMRLGYVLKNPAVFNILLLAVIAVLYDRRAKYEEDILSHSDSYVDYSRRVKYRFIWGVY